MEEGGGLRDNSNRYRQYEKKLLIYFLYFKKVSNFVDEILEI